MMILSGWSNRLKHVAHADHACMVLDEGAVEMMAWLRVKGSAYVKSDALRGWWMSTYETWAGLLDMVIYLDAPPACLLDRVRSRDAGWTKMQSEAALALFADLQAAHEEIRPILLKNNIHMKVLHFSTVEQPTDAIMGEILCSIGVADRTIWPQ